MTISLTLCSATGALYLDERSEAKSPNRSILCGNLIFTPPYLASHGVLHLMCSATLLDTRGNSLIYRLAVAGGLVGYMIAAAEKQDESDPDYQGHLGTNGELSVSGWNRDLNGMPYIALTVGMCVKNLAAASGRAN